MKWKVNTTPIHKQAGALIKIPKGNHYYQFFGYLPEIFYACVFVCIF